MNASRTQGSQRGSQNSRAGMDDGVTVRLTADEALVLDSLLSRFGEEDGAALVVEHPAERAAIWALQAALERELAAPLRPDYDRLLAAARERLRENAGL